MRDLFPEWYLPDAAGEERLVRTATVVLDTNVLLSLYRVTVAQREEILGALRAVADRLWIPFQVGLEYQRGRMGVIKSRSGLYARLIDVPGDLGATRLRANLTKLDLPAEVISELDELIDDLSSSLEEAAESFRAAARAVAEAHVIDPAAAIVDDPVRVEVDTLLAGRVGPRPDPDVRTQRIGEAKTRAAAKVPPGWGDADKDTEELAAGDYLLWSELLDYAEAVAEEATPFLLVTADTKPDWFTKNGNNPVGPLPELVTEFATRNPHGYHQLSLPRFLELANQHLNARVDPATIERADTLADQDELRALAYGALKQAVRDITGRDETANRDAVARLLRERPVADLFWDGRDGLRGTYLRALLDQHRSDSAHPGLDSDWAISRLGITRPSRMGQAEAAAVDRLIPLLGDLGPSGREDLARAKQRALDGLASEEPAYLPPAVSLEFVAAVASAAAFLPEPDRRPLVGGITSIAHSELDDGIREVLINYLCIISKGLGVRAPLPRDWTVGPSSAHTETSSQRPAKRRSAREPSPQDSEQDDRNERDTEPRGD